MGSFTSRGELDPHRPLIIACLGRKRSGKSVMARLLFNSYPWDRLVIDVAGDDGPTRADVKDLVELHGTVDDLPGRWPESERVDDRPMTLRYVPDPGSPTYLEDMDAVVGLAWTHQRTAILVHEMGILAKSGRVPAHTRRVLQMSRHNRITLIACAPRPITMDPLVIAQADLVYAFELPNRADRERVAETIGWPADEIHDGIHALGPHEYLRYDANEAQPEGDGHDLRLIHCPALPADVVAGVT
jgi:hypothetical protein